MKLETYIRANTDKCVSVRVEFFLQRDHDRLQGARLVANVAGHFADIRVV